MLNIASGNMPKIKPETKVLIIKILMSKSPAEVADIFNVFKRKGERIRKGYQETGDVHDRPRSGRPRKITARDDSLLVRLSKARPRSDISTGCLVIPQVPLSFSGGRSFWDGQHSLQIWILSGEEWRRKHGGPSRRTWRSPPCHPRRLHQQALRLSAKPHGNCSVGQRNPYNIWIT